MVHALVAANRRLGLAASLRHCSVPACNPSPNDVFDRCDPNEQRCLWRWHGGRCGRTGGRMGQQSREQRAEAAQSNAAAEVCITIAHRIASVRCIAVYARSVPLQVWSRGGGSLSENTSTGETQRRATIVRCSDATAVHIACAITHSSEATMDEDDADPTDARDWRGRLLTLVVSASVVVRCSALLSRCCFSVSSPRPSLQST